MSLQSLIEQLRDFDSALLANTIGYIDPTPAHEFYMAGSIQAVTTGLGPTVGVAVTCEIDTSTPGAASEWEPFYESLEKMEAIAEPVVWVVKTVGARPEHECVLGDGMAKMLFAAGCVGVVTDGGVRDVAGMKAIPFAAYARGTTIHHCAIRVRNVNEPVEVGGIVVRPGDVIHGSSEGVIKIPAGCLAELPQRAVKMRAFEH